MKTSELTGKALRWAVVQIECTKPVVIGTSTLKVFNYANAPKFFSPEMNWAHGGVIIEREGIEICPIGNGEWRGQLDVAGDLIRFYGGTPLIAAMRCYVASKLGDEVEIPEELNV